MISTRVGGIPYLNEGGERIRLIEAGRVEDLAAEILTLLADPALQRRLAASAREYVRVEFDNALNLDRQMESYKQVIAAYQQERNRE